MIRPTVERLSSGGETKPVWLWWSRVDASDADIDRCWQMYLRRFDIEHTFRLLKQTLGRTVPKLRAPEAADRWVREGAVGKGPGNRNLADGLLHVTYGSVGA